MSRRRPKNKSSSLNRPRDTPAIANFTLRPISVPTRSGRALQEREDRRTFYPGVSRPVRTFRNLARLVVPKAMRPGPRQVASRLSVVKFRAPEATLVCVRRQRRREVLHAKGVAGSSVRRGRRNDLSNISCRRK